MRFILPLLLAVGTATVVAAEPKAPVDAVCEEIARRLASVKLRDCTEAGLQVGSVRSVNGRVILWRDFPPAPLRVAERRVLMVGGIHGDEFSSISIVFKWMQQLNAAKDQQNFHWRVLPSLNPDGLLVRPSTRMNANGVDLNRNFPSPDWESRAPQYWKTRTGSDPRRFPGTAGASEPESKLLVEQIQDFKPDVVISIHAPYGVLDYDGPHQPPEKLGYLHLHQLGTYPGSLGEYSGQFLGVPVVTLELPHAGIMPTDRQIDGMWTDLQQWLKQGAPRIPKSVPQIRAVATYRLVPAAAPPMIFPFTGSPSASAAEGEPEAPAAEVVLPWLQRPEATPDAEADRKD